MSTKIYCNRFSCTIIKYKPYYLYDNRILPGLEFTQRKSLSGIGSQVIYFLHKLNVYMHENDKASNGFVLLLIILTNVSHLLIHYYLNKWWSSTKVISINSHADFLTKTKTKKIQQIFLFVLFYFFYVWCPFFIIFQPLDTDSTHWHNYPGTSAIFQLSPVSFPYFNGLNISWGWFRRLSYKLWVTNNASLFQSGKK